VQLITRSLIHVDLLITPDLLWYKQIHSNADSFYIMAEDVDGKIVLFSDTFVLRQR
jgi:pre-mRNA-splicing helicase BRR2